MNPSPSQLRRFARVTALAVLVALPLMASPSYAEVPEGWSEPAAVDGLEALLLLVGIPILLFVAITLLVLAPSLARGERSGAGVDEWFGGPAKGTNPTAGSSEPSETGGASGSW